MFCKKCGNQLEHDAAFCPSCGTQITAKKTPQEVPHQFKESYHGIDESKKDRMLYEKSAFKGKSVGFSSSGTKSFNRSNKKGGLFGKLIKLAIVGTILLVAISFLFGGDDALITNVETSDSINYDTFEPVGPTDLFDDSIPTVFTTFSTNGVEVGQVITVEFYNEDTLIDLGTYTAQLDSEQIAFQLPQPTSGWEIGAVYRVEIFVGEEFITSTTFTFEP